MADEEVETVCICELARGDRVKVDDGVIAWVKNVERNRLFEGYAFEVETDLGTEVLDGHDKVERVI